MYMQCIYQPFAQISAKRLVFGVLVHHRDGTFEQVELFSMAEDNRKMFTQAMRFEGMKLHESEIDSVLNSGVLTSVLAVSKSPRRRAALFSPSLYFEVVGAERLVLSDYELEQEMGVDSRLVHAECVRSMRSLLCDAVQESDGVYMILDHCLSDFLDEANMEIREYIARWNNDSVNRAPLVPSRVSK